MAALRAAAQVKAVTDAAQTASKMLGAMATLFKGSKPIAVAQALVNTFLGVTEALKLPFPENIAAAAVVAAQGMAAIKTIMSASPSGGGAATGSAAASGAATAAKKEPDRTQTFSFNIQNDSMGFGESFARQMVEQLNNAQRNGGTIRGVIP
jgi:hypothetical protein